jgi:hypothetical protein
MVQPGPDIQRTNGGRLSGGAIVSLLGMALYYGPLVVYPDHRVGRGAGVVRIGCHAPLSAPEGARRIMTDLRNPCEHMGEGESEGCGAIVRPFSLVSQVTVDRMA